MTGTKRTLAHRVLAGEHQLGLAIAAGVTLAAGLPLWFWAAPALLQAVGRALIWLSLGLGAMHGLRAALESMRRFKPDIDVLMVAGAALSAAIGHPEEGALLLFLFTLAGALEQRAMARAKDAVSRLHQLMPRAALRKDHDGAWIEVEPEALRPGDLVLVRPGEAVPADGVLTTGRTTVDQSTLTGESMPKPVRAGDSVFAGTLNGAGAIEVEVTRPASQSSLQRILQLVLEAQERRQPVQRVIDRFSTPYTITVFAAALATLIGFRLAGGLAWSDAAYKAITLLVVASPCALVIATPTATLCGLSRAARSGVLIKGADALERLARVRHVALDKTGTLTTGQIEVTHVQPVGASDVDSLLSIALAAEQRSTHPIAAAIVRLAEQHHLRPANLASLTSVPGEGLEGSFRGRPVRIGDMDFCEALIPICFRRHTQQLADHIAHGGGKPIVIAYDGGALVLALADTPREGADDLTADLREVGVSGVTMLTGDTRVIAERVAAELGIEDVHAELLPEEKVDHLRRLRAEGHGEGGLAVVGDGVNDAPALAVADVGLAMGGIGADAALETADVVLLHDHLSAVPWSIGLARRVKGIMIANLVFATAVIALLAVCTLLRRLPLSLGVLGHEGSTLLVVANSLRLLGHRGP